MESYIYFFHILPWKWKEKTTKKKLIWIPLSIPWRHDEHVSMRDRPIIIPNEKQLFSLMNEKDEDDNANGVSMTYDELAISQLITAIVVGSL